MAEKKDESRKYKIWLSVLGITLLAGLFTAYKLITEGLGVLGGNDIVIWPLPIATYIFFALTSTGLTFVASMPLVFGMKQFDLIAKRAVFLGIATLLAAFAALSMDLGSITNLVYFLTSPNFSSPMWWMGAIYTLELIMLAVKFWRMHVDDWHSKTSKIIGGVAFISAIAATSTLGMVFGNISARPTYFGMFAPVYFLATAFLSGLALIILFSLAYNQLVKVGAPDQEVLLYNTLGKIMALSSGIVLVLFLIRTIAGMANNGSEFLAFDHFVGSFTYNIVLWLGLFLPLLLMILPKVRATITGKVIASMLILFGLFLERMSYVLIGQLKPLGVRSSGIPGLINHSSSIWEWVVVASSLAFLLLAYTLGEKYLELGTTDKSA